MSSEDKSPGRQVLVFVDRLVAIITSGKEGINEEQMKQGYLCMQRLLDILEQMIGPHQEYLKEAVKELIKQRMPDKGYPADLDNIIDVFYRQLRGIPDPQPTPNTRAKAEVKNPEDKLERAINFLFPRSVVIKDFRHKGQVYQYYIPELKLAVLDCSGAESNALNREYYNRKAGIQVIAVDCRMLPCSREIARQIKRQVDTARCCMLKSK